MEREATQTIKGFNYQLNKTILEILTSEEKSIIMVEGYNEDIDVFTDDGIRAVQCKYYESANKPTTSLISPTILQMMCTFVNNPNILFELFMYYTGCTVGEEITITNSEIENILNTKDKNLISRFFPELYEIEEDEIKNTINKKTHSNKEKKLIRDYFVNNRYSLKLKININEFIKNIKIICGQAYDKIISDIYNKIEEMGYDLEEARMIYYPNAFQMIAEIATFSDGEKRKIDPAIFSSKLFGIKTVLITKWLDKLDDNKENLKYLKNIIKTRLQINTSDRVFIIEDKAFANFEKNLCSFITDYVRKYNIKPKLHKAPTFLIVTDNDALVDSVVLELYNNRNIKSKEGKVGNKVLINELFSDCLPSEKLRLSKYDNEIEDYLKKHKPDDLYIVGNIDDNFYKEEGIYIQNINCVKDINNLKKIFILGG